MLHMELTLFSSCMILLIVLDISCFETESKGALIFDRISSKLLLLPKRVLKTNTCGAWATACPAPKSAVGGSFMENALVVKEIYDKGGKTIEVKMKVCEEPYKIAVAFDIVKFNFRFGFAIYYRLRDEEYFHRSNLKYFMTPKEITEIMRKYTVIKGKYLRGKGFKIRKAVEKDNRFQNDELWFNGNRRMEFMWIHMFNLRFDFFTKILSKITYSIQRNNKWPIGERCDDYSLGFEVYEETNVNYVDDLYSEKNQHEIFQNMNIPVRQCTGETCPVLSLCESKKKCLSKWLLIPIDQFTFGSSSTSACSDLATVPIWTDRVEKVLKKVDQYLYTLNRITKQTLLITSGVSGDVLELPITNSWRKKTSEVYLDPTKKKIPVPKIIYKLVRYRVRSDPNSQINSSWFSALIVIHNDPYYKKGTRICHENLAEKWGWQEITKDPNGGEFENVYVCEADGNVLRKVMGRWIAAKLPASSDLNLEKFPSGTIGDKSTRNMKIAVDKEFNSISDNGASLNSDDELLERDEEIFPLSEDEGEAVEVDEKIEASKEE